jgi:hypothetical protein
MARRSLRRVFGGVAALAGFLGAIGTPTFAAPSSTYFTPAVKPGERIDTIFSKAVAITGTDFDPVVRRISGTGSYEIEAVTPNEITGFERYLYDGRPPGSGRVVIRDHGMTDCDAHGKCRTNDSTSASLFDSLLWGPVPDDIAVGNTWDVKVKTSWEIGPPGTEKVSVVRLDPGLGQVTLVRRGHGAGRSSDDAVLGVFVVVSHGHAFRVKLKPGAATWEGRATFIRGVTVADEIMLTRPVELTSVSGRVFHGSERIYTIFTER